MPNLSIVPSSITQDHARFMATYRAWVDVINILKTDNPRVLGPLAAVYDFFDTDGNAKPTAVTPSAGLSSIPSSSSNEAASSNGASSGPASSNGNSSRVLSSSNSASSNDLQASLPAKPVLMPYLPGQVIASLRALGERLAELPDPDSASSTSVNIMLASFLKSMHAFLQALNLDEPTVDTINHITETMLAALAAANSLHRDSTLSSSIQVQIQQVSTKHTNALASIEANAALIETCNAIMGDKDKIREATQPILSMSNNADNLGDYLLASLLGSVNELNYSGMRIVFNDQQLAALVKVLGANQTLAELNLRNNNFGDAGVIALAAALKVNETLVSLHLEGNAIGDASAIALTKALKVNQTLVSLGLGNNDISDAGTIALAKALKANQALTWIDLSYNPIGEAGMTALAEALTDNQALARLALCDNNIGEAGAITLAKALKVNKTLAKLNLWGNNIGGKGAAALADMLEVNRALTVLLFESDGVSPETCERIEGLLKRNQHNLAQKGCTLTGSLLSSCSSLLFQSASSASSSVSATAVQSLSPPLSGPGS